ncbi:hypothetical protein OUZ56_032387 [Daphnia magna]|uniref:Uncharacterized protein n=1 Tax=Daphnia magna TaxID=35525 RepID=A0ABR0B8S4_9CRUS|nr:hypothetical protein OUZ56_032387 [Daphnia magna]
MEASSAAFEDRRQALASSAAASWHRFDEPLGCAGDPRARPQAAAYERLLPRILAVPKHRLRPLNVDVSTIASRIYGAVRHFPTFAETLAKLPDYRYDVVAELRDLVGALLYVDSLVRITHASLGSLPELLARAMQLRELLTADARTLIARKVLPPDSLDHLTGRTGAVRLGSDLGALGAIFAKAWDRIEGRCGATKEEVHEANRLHRADDGRRRAEQRRPAAEGGPADPRPDVHARRRRLQRVPARHALPARPPRRRGAPGAFLVEGARRSWRDEKSGGKARKHNRSLGGGLRHAGYWQTLSTQGAVTHSQPLWQAKPAAFRGPGLQPAPKALESMRSAVAQGPRRSSGQTVVDVESRPPCDIGGGEEGTAEVRAVEAGPADGGPAELGAGEPAIVEVGLLEVHGREGGVRERRPREPGPLQIERAAEGVGEVAVWRGRPGERGADEACADQRRVLKLGVGKVGPVKERPGEGGPVEELRPGELGVVEASPVGPEAGEGDRDRPRAARRYAREGGGGRLEVVEGHVVEVGACEGGALRVHPVEGAFEVGAAQVRAAKIELSCLRHIEEGAAEVDLGERGVREAGAAEAGAVEIGAGRHRQAGEVRPGKVARVPGCRGGRLERNPLEIEGDLPKTTGAVEAERHRRPGHHRADEGAPLLEAGQPAIELGVAGLEVLGEADVDGVHHVQVGVAVVGRAEDHLHRLPGRSDERPLRPR